MWLFPILTLVIYSMTFCIYVQHDILLQKTKQNKKETKTKTKQDKTKQNKTKT